MLCLGKMSENPQSNMVLEGKLTLFKSSSQHRTLDTIDDDPMKFEWNISTGFTTLQLCYKVQEFLSKMSIQPQDFIGRISLLVDVSTTSHGDLKKISKNANQALNSFQSIQKYFHQEDGHSLDLDQKKK